MPYRDPAKRAEYNRRYRARNPEAQRQAERRWKAKNSEKIAAGREQRRQWLRDNPEVAAMRAAHRRQKRDPKKERRTWLKYMYGITPEQHDEMLARQGGVCAMPGCAAPPPPGGYLDTDHDPSCCPGKPTCGKCLRGLLCRRCNQSVLGRYEKNRQRCEEYLERFVTPGNR